jgi:EAL domain-containing protein (putative c-di-GMP-specific phosphodiesterase class I)
LERGELEVYYQPLVALAGREVTGFEALLRWHHPDRGFISPAEFIPIAEETGIIVQIGEFVLETAAAQLVEWQRTLPAAARYKMSVNLSARQLMGSGPVAMVADVIARTGVRPGHLWLEVTESLMTGDTQSSLRMLNELRDLGVRLVIDDFGTGYSSLNYVRDLPVEVVKIDRAFVMDLDNPNPEKAEDACKLVGAIVAMVAALNLEVVAEGIETCDQRDVLTAMGCGHGQGYLFSRPIPAREIPEALTALEAIRVH